MVDAKAHRHLQLPTSKPKNCDNATMVDAKAHLHLHLQQSNVTTPQWWMLRPIYICNLWHRHNGGCQGPPTSESAPPTKATYDSQRPWSWLQSRHLHPGMQGTSTTWTCWGRKAKASPGGVLSVSKIARWRRCKWRHARHLYDMDVLRPEGQGISRVGAECVQDCKMAEV